MKNDHTQKIRRIIGVLLSLGMLSHSISNAGDIATERTQFASAGILAVIRDADEAIRGFTQEIERLEALAGAQIPELLADKGVDLPGAEDVFEIFDEIETVMQAGQGLSHTYGQLEVFLETRFDDYEGYLQGLFNLGYIDTAVEQDRFQTWSTTHTDTVRNVLQSHGIHAAQVETAKDRLALLQELSQDSVGRMQALQVGQEIAIEEVKQLHTLRELMMEQSDLHASYFSYKAAEKANEEAISTFTLRKLMPTDPNNGVAFPR